MTRRVKRSVTCAASVPGWPDTVSTHERPLNPVVPT